MLEQDVRNTGKVLVLGHRGAMGYAPENTMASFELGRDLGSDMLELDVHLSKDKELVIMHDGDVSRTTDGNGRVRDMTLNEIKQLDAGVTFDERFKGQRVPTLEEVLSWAKGRIPLVIEIKGDPHPAPEIGEKLVAAVEQYGMQDSVVVISFHHPVVKHVKALAPELATGILYTGRLADPVGAARAANADSVRPQWSYWTREDVEAVHAADLVAHAWNADAEERMEYLVGLGVDSIGSNYPDRLRAFLDRNGLSWTQK
jgi:glycerophosphoryl diester phosphodiesterase